VPYAVAGALALAATVEVRGATLLYVVLAVTVPLPLALARAHPFAGAAVISVTFGVAWFAYERPLLSAAAAQAVALTAVAKRLQIEQRSKRQRAQAMARQGTLLAHAARDERARIARELHDVVAHHISIVAVLADAARLMVPGMPQEGVKRLVTIGDTARTALTEMRRLLGVLREDAGDGEPNRLPQPGLAQLNGLVDEARRLSTASIRLIVRGNVAPLDPGIQLAAYRIVQEALTNARRHAAGASVDVELDYRAGELLVRVRDNGPGVTAGEAGHGLTGMRERAMAAGGRVSTGACAAGGFLVEAVLPT